MDELIGKLEKHLQVSSGRQRFRLAAKKWAWLVVIGGSRIAKRTFDLVGGCVLTLASLPLFGPLPAVLLLSAVALTAALRDLVGRTSPAPAPIGVDQVAARLP